MTSTVWRDGYGSTVEVVHGTPEVCPDGIVRTWCTVLVCSDDIADDVLELRLQPSDLADLATMLQAVAAAVTA